MAEPGLGARQLAELFHDRYERLAPQFGYETRVETRAFDPTSKNGRLMIAVCDEILNWFDLRVTADELVRLRAIILAARRNGSIPQYPGDVDETKSDWLTNPSAWDLCDEHEMTFPMGAACPKCTK